MTDRDTLDALNLEKLFRPRAIAVVGASEDLTSIGGKPLRNLMSHDYEGAIYPVNPKYREIAGLECFSSLSAVPGEIDVALVAVSQARTMSVLEDCASKGVEFAFLFGAGFAEVGEEGEALQDEVVRLAREHGIRFLGPNCLGCLNALEGVPMGFSTSFETESFLPGPVGLASQSGAFGYALFALAQDEAVGFSYVANTGNQADLDTLDFMAFMVEDESTSIVSAYLESVPDGDRFVRIAERARKLDKPVVVLKAGRSALGQRAALSHTASLTGSGQAFRAVAEQHGVTLVDDIEEMVDAMKVFSRGKHAAGNRVAVVTTSGATGILMADYCDDLGLEMNPLSDTTRQELAGIIPSYGSALNPVDITAQALNDREIFRGTIRTLADDDDVDAIVVTTTFGRGLLESMCHDLVELDRATSKPLLVTLTGSEEIIASGEAVLKAAGVPMYVSPYRTAKALSYLERFSRSRDDARSERLGDDAEEAADVTVQDARGSWTESQVKELLPRLNIPAPRGRVLSNARQAVEIGGELSYPVVAKVLSREIAHKTEAGAVELGISNSEELADAIDRILGSARRFAPHAPIDGVLVEEMAGGEGEEAFIGVTEDAQFGPLVVCGMGGIFAEVLRDTAVRRVPVSLEEARGMVSELKGSPLLMGARGRKRLDIEAMASAIVSVSRFAAENRSHIKEMDLNPLKVLPEGEGVLALDGMIVWK